MEGFRSGAYRIMVATDIAARGIDVLSISHVINYDMPDTADAYTHRIGRTGRAEQAGEAFSLFTPADVDALRAVERILGRRLERRTLPGFDYRGAAVSHNPAPVDEPELRPETHLNRGPQAGRRTGYGRPRSSRFRPAGRFEKSSSSDGGRQPAQ
jgi:ATP-dependent RNA helicase RhlE